MARDLRLAELGERATASPEGVAGRSPGEGVSNRPDVSRDGRRDPSPQPPPPGRRSDSLANGRFSVELLASHPSRPARVLRLTTTHGMVLTPAFMPVATRASNSGLTPRQLQSTGTQILLGGNPYHMLLSPGLDQVRALGGMHALMRWPGPMLTDSGGFQLFSLSGPDGLCQVDDEGGHVRLADGREIHLTPASSLDAQKTIGADIVMAFDDCTPHVVGREAAERALERTHRWLAEGREQHERRPGSDYGHPQAFFGIVQGASFRDLRERSASFVVEQDVDGVALGGESIGFDMRATAEILEWVRPLLPPGKPRYTMGVGLQPQDLIDAVAAGADLFDCVAPTRNARHASLYHGRVVPEGDWLRFASDHPTGRVDLSKAAFARDEAPILEGCGCGTCAGYSRAQLHHLLKTGDGSYAALAAAHNVHVMQSVCQAMRACIVGRDWDSGFGIRG